MSKLLEGEGAAAEWVPIERVHGWPGNPRRNAHVVPEIARSIEKFGWGRALVARKANGELVIGHTAYEAAKMLGLRKVPVRFVDLDEHEAHALAIADNKLGELAEWDDRMLLAQVRELEEKLPDFDAADLGFVQEDLDRLDKLAGIVPPAAGEDPGPQEPSETALSQPGEIFALGPHRLMCGDSTSEEDVQRLMHGERAVLCATDPPYLVDYDGTNHPSGKGKKKAWTQTTQKWAGKGDTTNKQWDEYIEHDTGSDLFVKYLQVAIKHALVDGGVPFYQWYASRRHVLVEEAWKANGLLVHQQIVWVKSRPILTRSHFMWQHEPCLYGWVEGSPPELRPEVCGANSTVWTIAKAGEEDGIHPTQKPLEIFERPIRYHTKEGDLVFEPFCGSGSQLIAAAKLGRRCYAMEKAPEFCDAIRRRWTKFAQSSNVDAGTGALA